MLTVEVDKNQARMLEAIQEKFRIEGTDKSQIN